MQFSWKKNTAQPGSTLPEQEVNCLVSGISETGPSRSSNEDSILYLYPGGHSSLFAMVADGMGGHNAGEVASSIACNTARSFITTHYHNKEATALLSEVMQEANRTILSSAATEASHAGMGTTATMLLISNGQMYFAQVGDSRLYHYREGVLMQCSTDQTLVNNLVQEGKIRSEDADSHPDKHILTQALGSSNTVQPEVPGEGMPVVAGDRFLICSDGVYEVLKRDELQSLMSIKKSEMITECIKALCIQRRVSDNFSVILVDITNDKQPVDPPKRTVPITKEQNVPS